jgi:quercetin dioxygenase-like cupin family protein
MVSPTISPFATQLQDEVEYGHSGMFRKYLVKGEKHTAMLICLQAGIHIPEHTSAHDGFITVIQGLGTFWLAGQEVALTPGMFVELPANTLHALTALENLALLKVVESHEAKEPATGSKKSSCQDGERIHSTRTMTCAETLAAMLKPYLQGAAIAEPPKD